MYREQLVLHERRERQVVEEVGEDLPDVGVAVLAQALVVEAVDLRDLPALVVPSDERDPVRVAHLQREQQQEGLDGVEAAVDEVAHEEVVGVGYRPPHFEELLQVVKLPVDVAADRYRGIDALHIALFNKDLTGLGAQALHLRLFDVLASLELLYLAIQIGTSHRPVPLVRTGTGRPSGTLFAAGGCSFAAATDSRVKTAGMSALMPPSYTA